MNRIDIVHYEIAVHDKSIVSNMFIMDHMVIQPVIIKFSDGIRK